MRAILTVNMCWTFLSFVATSANADDRCASLCESNSNCGSGGGGVLGEAYIPIGQLSMKLRNDLHNSRRCKAAVIGGSQQTIPFSCSREQERLKYDVITLHVNREYAPRYALRSYFYLLPSFGAATLSRSFLSLFGYENDKPQVIFPRAIIFHIMRMR